jgi:integral membrane protein (TIGR01906 family)
VAVAAVLWALLVTGSAVTALTIPAYTSAMTQALKVPQTAGLPAADVVRLSGQVRALVADSEFDPLPSTFAGAPAFDAAAVSHLMDVRSVIGSARLATGITSLLLATYVGLCVGKRRFRLLTSGMKVGSWVIGGLLLVAVMAASTDFSSFFTAFHGLFFASGTWTFSADSLLIRLFPERFWMASGVAWAVLMAAGAALLLIVAGLVRGAEARLNASRMGDNV